MKKQILEALKAKFLGVSESVLNRIADKLAKTVLNDDDVTTSVDGVTFNQVLESYGDSRATEAQQTAVSNYERKHSLKDGQKAQGGESQNEPSTAGGDMSAQIAAAIAAAMKPLHDEITTLKSGKTSENRKQKLETAIAKASDKFKSAINRDYPLLSFKEDTDFEAWLGSVQSDAEEDAQSTIVKGAVFTRPIGGGATANSKPTDKEIKSIEQSMGL